MIGVSQKAISLTIEYHLLSARKVQMAFAV
jgi:hypothetical protein